MSKTAKPTSDKKTTPDTVPSAIVENTKLTVKIPWTTVAPSYDKTLKKAAQNVKTDGFRKGKVPLAIVEQMIDKSKLMEQVLDEVLPAAYRDALNAAKKSPISQPEIEPVAMEKGQDWEFSIFFAERPEIKLGKYQDAVKKGLVEAAKEITEKDKELKKAPKDKKAEAADHHNHAHDDGHDHSHDHATAPTELNDHQKEDIKYKHIFKNLVESVQPKVPEILVRQDANRELQRLVEQLQQLKIDVNDYLKSRGMEADQLRQEYMAIALSTLQLEFILAEIAKVENITVTDADVDKTLDEMMGGKLTEEEKAKSEYRSYLFSTLVKQKVVKFLLSLEK
jgi:FKBP-type peptidyl-prolyl cis-trans isomerase (trigger factor)